MATPCAHHAFQSQAYFFDEMHYLNDIFYNERSSRPGCPDFANGTFNNVSEPFRNIFIGSKNPTYTVFEMEDQVYQTKQEPEDVLNMFDYSQNINHIGLCTNTSTPLQAKRNMTL